MKTQQYIIIFLFVLVTVGLSSYSFLGSFDSSDLNAEAGTTSKNRGTNDDSFFKTVDYYMLDKTKPFLQLEAVELTISQNNTLAVASNPDGVIFRRNDSGVEEDPINFKSKQAQVMTTKQLLYLNDEVEIEVATSNLKAKAVTIFDGGKYLEASGDVRTHSFDLKTNDQILINSDFATYKPRERFFEYQKHVKGNVQRRRVYEENVYFTTDLLTLNQVNSEVEMKGNVTFKKGNLDASSNQGSVFLENYNKKLKYYSLSDDVRLQETLIVAGKPSIRKGFAEKLEGLISEKKVVLTGLPKVFQEKDVIKGNRIIIRENVETVEVDDANTNITLESDKEKI